MGGSEQFAAMGARVAAAAAAERQPAGMAQRRPRDASDAEEERPQKRARVGCSFLETVSKFILLLCPEDIAVF
jgi:hypothetical protein